MDEYKYYINSDSTSAIGNKKFFPNKEEFLEFIYKKIKSNKSEIVISNCSDNPDKGFYLAYNKNHVEPGHTFSTDLLYWDPIYELKVIGLFNHFYNSYEFINTIKEASDKKSQPLYKTFGEKGIITSPYKFYTYEFMSVEEYLKKNPLPSISSGMETLVNNEKPPIGSEDIMIFEMMKLDMEKEKDKQKLISCVLSSINKSYEFTKLKEYFSPRYTGEPNDFICFPISKSEIIDIIINKFIAEKKPIYPMRIANEFIQLLLKSKIAFTFASQSKRDKIHNSVYVPYMLNNGMVDTSNEFMKENKDYITYCLANDIKNRIELYSIKIDKNICFETYAGKYVFILTKIKNDDDAKALLNTPMPKDKRRAIDNWYKVIKQTIENEQNNFVPLTINDAFDKLDAIYAELSNGKSLREVGQTDDGK